MTRVDGDRGPQAGERIEVRQQRNSGRHMWERWIPAEVFVVDDHTVRAIVIGDYIEDMFISLAREDENRHWRRTRAGQLA